MPRSLAQNIKQVRDKIGGVRAALADIEYLCSGTLHMRMKVCGKPGCRCAQDPQARHGPYYEWGHMIGGKLVHRMVTPAQAEQNFLKTMRPTTLIQRFATTEEVANMVVYVASEQASATTGAALRVDGGVLRSIV